MQPLERFRKEFGLTYEMLGTMLGVDKSQASRWCNGQRIVGIKRAMAIEAAIGVSRAELRPDIFGPPKESLGTAVPQSPPPAPRRRRAAKPGAAA